MARLGKIKLIVGNQDKKTSKMLEEELKKKDSFQERMPAGGSEANSFVPGLFIKLRPR